MGSQHQDLRVDPVFLPIQANDKTYAVVELKVSSKSPGITSPCLIAWLRDVRAEVIENKERFIASHCYWPPRESQVSDFLVNKKKPKTDWKVFKNVRIFTFCKTLSKANSLADLATQTSDVTDSSESPVSGKRNRKSTDFYHAGGNSSSEEDYDERPLRNLKICGGHSKSPSLKGRSRSPSPSTSNRSRDSSVSPTGSRRSPPSRSSNRRSRSSSSSPLHSPVHDSTGGPKHGSNTLVGVASRTQVAEGLNGGPKPNKSNTSAGTSGTQVVQVLSTPGQSLNQSLTTETPHSAGLNNSRFLAHFVQMRSEIQEVKRMLLRIYIITCGPQEGTSDVEDIPMLPLQTLDAYNKFCTLCEKEDARLGMAKFLSEHGCSEFRESIFSMLRRLMSNQLAMTFNLTGAMRKGVDVAKTKFEGTAPYLVLKAAVKQHTRALKDRGADARHQYMSKLFRSTVSDWLKDAKKRADNEKARESKKRKRGEDGESDGEVDGGLRT